MVIPKHPLKVIYDRFLYLILWPSFITVFFKFNCVMTLNPLYIKESIHIN